MKNDAGRREYATHLRGAAKAVTTWRRRDLALAGAAACAGLLTAALPWRVRAQPAAAEPPAEAAGEVYAVILASQYTVLAIRDAADRKVRDLLDQRDAQRRRVVQLEAQVKAGLAQAEELRTEAAKVPLLERQVVMALAALDREYALSMYELRARLVRLSSQPAGLAALGRFRSGEYAQALAELDSQAEQRWRTRQEQRASEDAAALPNPDPQLAAELKARLEKARRTEDAADRRDVALLAWEALGRPGVPTVDVVNRLRAVVRLDPTVAWDSVLLARLHRQQGNLREMEDAAATALRYPLTERDRALALSEVGFSWRLLGRLQEARKALTQALELRERQLASEPEAADLKRYLSVAHERIGELEMDEGRFEKAQEHFQRAVEQRRRLAGTTGAAPPTLSARRDLALALGHSGRALLEHGDVARARDVLKEAMREARGATDQDPRAPEPLRDLAVLLAREGDGALLDGQLDPARAAYKESLVLREQLAKADPSSQRAKRDVTVAMLRLADLRLRQEGPSPGIRDDLNNILRQLPDTATGDAPLAGDLRRDRLIVEGKLAWLKVLQRDHEPAIPALKRVAEEWERIDKQQPGQPMVWRDHALALTRWGDALTDRRKWPEAKAPLELALKQRRALLERDPRARGTRAGVARVCSCLTELYKELKDARADAVSSEAKRIFSELVRETNNTLDGVPDSPELVIAIAQMADSLNDHAYAEKIAPAVKSVRQRIKLVPRDEQRLQAVRLKGVQS